DRIPGGSRAGCGPRRPSAPIRGPDRNRGRALLDRPGIGIGDGEPLGQRAALHLGHGEPAGDPRLGPAREPAVRRAARLSRARGGGDPVRLPAGGGPPAESEGGELRAAPRDEGPGSRGGRATDTRRPAERDGFGGRDRALPPPAAAGTTARVRRRAFLLGSLLWGGAPAVASVAGATPGGVRVSFTP